MNHESFMKIALQEAKTAGKKGEVPVGAVLTDRDGNIVSRSHNQTVSMNDPSAHAEMLAIRYAGKKLGNYRLLNTCLYVTIEPCVMCMGAVIHARIERVVIGSCDLKWGAAGSLYNFPGDDRLNHHPEIVYGVYEDTCKKLIQDFFRAKRKKGIRNE